ncbi:MAG: hypothetical protein LBM98_00655 [Oscillospiraceae bacterium]|nr:hypothetical protein [Oscillospiraceae bacterium]
MDGGCVLRPTSYVLRPTSYVLRPTSYVHRPGAVRRFCEAPVRPRYVGRYRCEAIQCRGGNIRPTSRRTVIASRAKLSIPRHPRPSPRPYPLCGGVPPAGGGVVSPAGRVTYVSADCGTGLPRAYTSYVSRATRRSQ